MDVHKNARLTPKGREEMARSVVEQGLSRAAAARRFNATSKTVAKWVGRFRDLGVEGLRDRSSKPLSSPGQTSAATIAAIEALRRRRLTGARIAKDTGVSPATVSRILKRLGLNLFSALEPAPLIRRYERATPGEIIHIDIKKLGRFHKVGPRITGSRRDASRGAGWEFAHVVLEARLRHDIDDCSRVARIDLMPDEKKETPSPSSMQPSHTTGASASPSRAS